MFKSMKSARLCCLIKSAINHATFLHCSSGGMSPKPVYYHCIQNIFTIAIYIFIKNITINLNLRAEDLTMVRLGWY